MSQILTMAMQNLNVSDRDDMVRYMKQAMVGTFFERWLNMAGWVGRELGESDDGGGKMPKKQTTEGKNETTAPINPTRTGEIVPNVAAMPAQESDLSHVASRSLLFGSTTTHNSIDTAEKPTSAAELEKLIRAIGTNPNLNAEQKNLTIQGLRDSVWKSNCRVSKRKREEDGTTKSQQQSIRSNTTSRLESLARQPHQTHHLRYMTCAYVYIILIKLLFLIFPLAD